MPYKTVYVKPKVFLRFRGVTIYHTYKDDEIDNGPSTFWFAQDHDEGIGFDVRELETWREPPHPPFLCGKHDTEENRKAWDQYHKSGSETTAIRKAIREAIKKGILQ